MPDYYAHSAPGECQPSDRWQTLSSHLSGVAAIARDKAGLLGNEQFASAAELTGWLHDVGKYRHEFQELLLGLRCKSEATRHKQVGAAWAAEHQRPDIAFAVAGHHGGLPDSDVLKSLIHGPGGQDVCARVRAVAVADCPALAGVLPKLSDGSTPFEFDIWVRLLFSCLVDADWSDTGAHERDALGIQPLPKPQKLDPAELTRLIKNVSSYIEGRRRECLKGSARSPDVPSVRAEILSAALAAADLSPGLFSMSVPTGGGKTLASLAFALAHARRHGLRRVIYVAPYLSIIEQNAREIRRALGATLGSLNADLVFEHHSLAEPSAGKDADEAASSAFARQAQNWSAPFVVTTNAQFFESLFSNQPGQCRKLHNIAKSIVVLDECQTLPPGVVAPTVSMLKGFCAMAGASMILCTATQPAWSQRQGFDAGFSEDEVREVIPAELDVFARLRRVTVRWPKKNEPKLDWPQVAERMQESPSALCIVNTKLAAAQLFSHFHEGFEDAAFHLSTAMCPMHRLQVLDEVRRRLKGGEPCFLVSTQLIEAGVDVDFPLVLRELAPLEAIVQSAGRCNREGKLRHADGTPAGQVIVFRSVESRLPGDGWYRAGRDVLESAFLNAGREPDIARPEQMLEYFRRLYASGTTLDEQDIENLRLRKKFATIWKGDGNGERGRYRIIKDDTISVAVATWGPHRMTVEDLLSDLATAPTPRVYRELSGYQVNMRSYEIQQHRANITMESGETPVWRGRYDERRGIVPENDDLDLVV